MSLSISRAWDETRDIIGRDSSALAVLVAALVMLPNALATLVDPQAAVQTEPAADGHPLLRIVLSLVIQMGSLAVTHVALTRSTTVGTAIASGARRLLPTLGAVLLFFLPLAFVLGMALVSVVGVTDPAELEARLVAGELGGPGSLVLLLWLVVMLYLGVRFLFIAPIAVAESSGPVAILKRSWAMTRGHAWRLLAFLLVVAIAALLVMMIAGVLFGIIIALLFGPPEPMSLAALALGLLTGAVTAAFLLVFAVMVARLYSQLALRPSVPEVGAD